MFKKGIIILSSLFLLSGCASGKLKTTTTYFNSDKSVHSVTDQEESETSRYHNAIRTHSQNESARIGKQAEAIANSVRDSNISSDAQAILAYIAVERIASLRPVEYSGKAPTTNADIGLALAGQASGLVKSVITGTVIYKGLDTINALAKNAGTHVNASDGSEVNVTQTENTAIASGEAVANAGNVGQPQSSNGVETEEGLMGVEPEIWEECTSGDATLGNAAGCFASNGYDIEIKGGIAYIDGEEFTKLNDWEAAK